MDSEIDTKTDDLIMIVTLCFFQILMITTACFISYYFDLSFMYSLEITGIYIIFCPLFAFAFILAVIFVRLLESVGIKSSINA